MKYINISIDENIFLKADVISLRDLDGREYIYYREMNKLASGSGKSNVYIAFTDESGIDDNGREEVAAILKSFYSLIGINKQIYYYKIGTQITTNLIRDNDVISIVNNKPKLLKQFVLDNLPSRYINCLSGLDEFISPTTTYYNTTQSNTSFERGFSQGQNITIVSKQRCVPYCNSKIDAFGCGHNINKFIAFLIFHGNGHNAGHVHESDCDFSCFMSSGEVLLGGFGNKGDEDNPCVFCTYNCIKTIEQLVAENINSSCKWVVDMMKNKY